VKTARHTHHDPAVRHLITTACADAWDLAHHGCICKRTVGYPHCANPYRPALPVQHPAATSDARKRLAEKEARA
jgi:hypothetical protein